MMFLITIKTERILFRADILIRMETCTSPTTRPASDFNEGAAVAVDAQGQHYYMDTNGRMLFDKRFIYAWNFKEGLAAVSPDGKHYGFIDKSGEYAIEPIYSFDALENVLNKEVFFSNGHADMDHYIMHFNNGYAIIADERTRTAAYIDKNGETLFDFYVPEDFFDYDPI